MKIVVLKLGRTSKLLLVLGIIVCITCIAYFSRMPAISVFTGDKDLPIYSVDCPEKRVAITFDCAWGAEDIPDILGTLKREDIRATFFILGQWAEKFPNTVRQIAVQGHDVANHSYSHLRMSSIGRSKVWSEIDLCGKKLSEISGAKVDLFRPPYGDYNNTVVGVARELGYQTVQWDVDSLDWSPGISQGEILSRIMTKVKPGSIILFHNDTPHTANMLPTIISSLRSKGYGFLPVSQLILKENYYIDHEGRQKMKE